MSQEPSNQGMINTMKQQSMGSLWLRSQMFVLAQVLMLCVLLSGTSNAQTTYSADLQVTASVNKAAAYTTETVTFTAVFKNNGPNTAPDVDLILYYTGIVESATLTTGTIDTSLPFENPANDGDIGNITHSLPVMAAGDVTTLTIKLKPIDNQSYQSFQIYAHEYGNEDPNPDNNIASVPIVGYKPGSDTLSIHSEAKAALPDYQGNISNWYTFTPFEFETTVVSLSESTISPVEIGNPIDGDFDIDSIEVEVAAGSVTDLVQNGTSVTLETIEPGTILKIHIIGQTSSAGEVSNYPSVIWGNASDRFPHQNNRSTVSISYTTNTDLAVSLQPSSMSVETGTEVTFDVIVTNLGPQSAANIPIQLTIPYSAYEIVSMDNSGLQSTDDVLWWVSLDSGESKTFSASAIVVKTGSRRVSAHVYTTNSHSDYNDYTPLNNTMEVSLQVTGPQFELVPQLTVSPGKVQPGGLIVQTMSVTNLGPDDATSITLQSLFGYYPNAEAYLTLYNIEDSGQWDFPYDLTSNTAILKATLPNLAADESATITAVFQNSYFSSGNARLRLAIDSALGDIDRNNNSIEQLVPVTTEADPGADLFITRTANPDPGVINQNLTYTVRGLNLGPDPTTTAYIGNILPKGCTLVSATSDKGTVNVNGKYVDVSDIPLAVGEAATLTMDVVPNQAGYITNQSGLSSADFDPDLNNNITTIDTQILETPECAEAVDLSAHLSKIQSRGKFKKKTGEWQFKVNTKVEISNNGTQCAPPTVVKLYLSDDPFIDESDILLDTKSVKTVCPSKKPRKVKFKVKLGNGQNPVGRYIIAVADGDNIVPECNEENNMAAGF